MNKNDILKTLKSVKDNSPKRKFKQSYDLIINVKNLDIKKTDNQIDTFIQLHHGRGKKIKLCALVGPELREAAKTSCDTVVELDNFDKYAKDKIATKKLAQEHDFFIAQANIMPKVAAAFGKVLGPKGKMPNPKAGCVVPPNANISALAEKLQNTVRVSVKVAPLFQCRIGSEDTKEEDIVSNAMDVYNSLIHALPTGQHNIRSIYLKLTMGPSVKVGGVVEPASDKKEKKPKEKSKSEKESKSEEKSKSEESKDSGSQEKTEKPVKEVKEEKKD
jgi:large subunit ribosomal protein L1